MYEKFSSHYINSPSYSEIISTGILSLFTRYRETLHSHKLNEADTICIFNCWTTIVQTLYQRICNSNEIMTFQNKITLSKWCNLFQSCLTQIWCPHRFRNILINTTPSELSFRYAHIERKCSFSIEYVIFANICILVH